MFFTQFWPQFNLLNVSKIQQNIKNHDNNLQYENKIWLCTTKYGSVRWLMNHDSNVLKPCGQTTHFSSGKNLRKKYWEKNKFFIKDLFSIFDQIRRKLRIYTHLLKRFLIKKTSFLCSVRFLFTKPVNLKD